MPPQKPPPIPLQPPPSSASRLPARKPSSALPQSVRPPHGQPKFTRQLPTLDTAGRPRQHSAARPPPQRAGKSTLAERTMTSQHPRDGRPLPQPRPPVPEPARTPSLVSGSSASTNESPRSNMLRRKDNFGRSGPRTSPDSASSQEEPRIVDTLAGTYEDPYPDAVFGITLPPTAQSTMALKAPDGIISLDRYVNQPQTAASDLPLPTQFYAMSNSSSTRYSPGPFSISSTPTSATTYSPSVAAGSRTPFATPRQISPVATRPQGARKMTNESVASRENNSSTVPVRQLSSSSGSTVRAADLARSNTKSAPQKSPSRPASRGKKAGSPAKLTKPMTAASKAEIAPEFAHLADAAPLKGTLAALTRPSRPSRDGTPEISVRETSPVVHSNMNSLPTVMHSRQRSTDSGKPATPALEPKSRFGFSRKSSSRNPSPSPSKSSASPALRGMTPDIASDSERPGRTQPSPNPEKGGSRFGFFKRSKDQTPAPPKEKRIRKGPIAGTGHEAYSKFSLRGRSGSTTSGPTARSPSADSTRTHDPMPSSRKSSIGSRRGSDVDEFVAERLNPITLRGNGPVQTGNEPVGHRKSGSSTDASLAPSSTSSLLARGPDVGRAPEKVSRFALSIATKRASRRSLLEPKSAHPQTDLFDNYHFPSHPAISPLERKMSEPSPTEQPPPEAPHAARRSETVPKVTPKLTRKWNFFQRAKAPPQKKPEKAPEPSVNLSKQMPRRSVAHYALQDAPDQIDVQELERIMQEAENTEQSPEEVAPEDAEPIVSKHGNSIILPAPPTMVPDFVTNRPASPKVSLQYDRVSPPKAEEEPRSYTPVMPPPQYLYPPVIPAPSLPPPEQPSPAKTTPRQSRLPQVGRIPRVVSRRDRDRKPSISSFSRPFDSMQPSPAMQSPTFPDGTPVNQDGEGALRPNPGNNGIQIMGQQPFFALPNNQVLFAPQGNAFANQLPQAPGHPSPAISIEEVWNEYDDLLDSLTAAPRTPHTGSSLGAPFPYMDMLSPINDSFAHGMLSPPPNGIPSVASIVQKIRFPSVRESQIYGAGHLALTPASTPSVSDFLLDRQSIPSTRLSSGGVSRLSLPPPAQRSQPKAAARHSQVSSGSSQESKKSRDSMNIQLAEARQMGFESMANLRFGALMTSKWLSFGRVLFSPVHDELKNPQDDRILIIDGLGKDWSYYVALTYPQATVYNLGSDPPEPTSKTPAAGTNTALQSLPNHKHIHHPGIDSPFPFPKGFFAAVVLRFLPVASETAYRFAVAESKRVLRPGGYLEASVLDIDMLNMGNRGRRATRALKERLHAVDRELSLKPLSDSIQRLIGRRGFQGLSRCFVGVPAAGCIPRSRPASGSGTPATEGSVAGTGAAGGVGPGATVGGQGFAGGAPAPSFGDLAHSNAAAPSAFGQEPSLTGAPGEEGITRMVARVSRWWYSRCYEAAVLAREPDGARAADLSASIWADAELLAECERRGTTLRLMVCFAQKPECAVRRTISV